MIKVKTKKGGLVEGIFFIAACVILVLAALLFLKREDNDYKDLLLEVRNVKTQNQNMETKWTDTNKRIDAVEVSIVQLPKNMNVVMKEPIKVLMKQLPPPSAHPIVNKVKKQLKKFE